MSPGQLVTLRLKCASPVTMCQPKQADWQRKHRQTKRYLWEFIFLIRVLGAGGPSEKCRGSETVSGKKAGGRGGRDRTEEGGHNQV